jgi:hypothetical protein
MQCFSWNVWSTQDNSFDRIAYHGGIRNNGSGRGLCCQESNGWLDELDNIDTARSSESLAFGLSIRTCGVFKYGLVTKLMAMFFSIKSPSLRNYLPHKTINLPCAFCLTHLAFFLLMSDSLPHEQLYKQKKPGSFLLAVLALLECGVYVLIYLEYEQVCREYNRNTPKLPAHPQRLTCEVTE